MLGYVWWFSLSVLLSLAALVAVWRTQLNRPLSIRVLSVLGLLALIWTLLPALGGFLEGSERASPILFLAAVAAFGMIAIVDAIDRLTDRLAARRGEETQSAAPTRRSDDSA